MFVQSHGGEVGSRGTGLCRSFGSESQALGSEQAEQVWQAARRRGRSGSVQVTPKLTLRTLSFLALRKGFSLLLGSREWDCVK